jgi:hypothetical protein
MTRVERHDPGTPCWVDLITADPEVARRFYGELFDWTFEVGPPETGPYTTCLNAGRAVAGISPKPPNAPFPTVWNLYFCSDNLERDAAQIGAHGGQVMMGPMDVFGEGRLLLAADPTGAFFGLWQPLRHIGAQVREEHGAMAWHEVNTRDASTAKTFYSAVFGLSTQRLDAPELEYYTLHHGTKAVAGVMQMTEQFPAEVPAHWATYFAVDDCDAASARVQELGGSITAPPFDTPYGRISVVSDPQGAVFCLVQLPPGS